MGNKGQQRKSDVDTPRMVTTIPFKGILSGKWRPRTFVEAVGALVIGICILLCGVAFVASAFMVRAEVRAIVHTAAISEVLSIVAIMLLLILAAIGLMLGFRFTTSAFTHASRRP